MTKPARAFPCCRAVAEHAVLIEFGELIARETNDEVRRLMRHRQPGLFQALRRQCQPMPACWPDLIRWSRTTRRQRQPLLP